MTDVTTWVRGPVGLDGEGRATRRGCKAVLAVVPTITAGTRLLDLLPVFDGDHRVHVVFTVPDAGDRWHGVDAFARGLGGLVLPWDQARRQRWDLVLAASPDCTAQVHGKLLLLPHGAGAGKTRARSRMQPGATRGSTGLDREVLTTSGRVVPAAIALPTAADRALLRRTCPEALPAAVVTGDICLARLDAGAAHRDRYRAALGVPPRGRLVTACSTWSTESAFGAHPDLLARLASEVEGTGTVVAAVFHPNVWAVHGAWQLRSWLADALAAGLRVLPPDRGWQAAVSAADVVLGDHGSTSVYSGALGARFALAAFPDGNTRPGSPGDVLARGVGRLDHDRPLRPQIDAASPHRDIPALRRAISARSPVPHAVLRRTAYALLDLPEPPWPARLLPPADPEPLDW
ncbi:hypothetical protein [Actinokineospora bangkokensis]|uniref:Translation initiation factor 2 n=1 Tax=Actinokineospora bangkokensis TaxID=1193682 RepID=A0A1Q9LCD2_9PSEU|nr:hypothetical protein [Actinokineospora bangkokensis]OLR89665.1 hypothetical protein BJP25_04725 [Actinokineospora bangkokensis]